MNYQQPNVGNVGQGYNAPQPAPTKLPNDINFIADQETIEILNNVYPESIPGLINLAIKKFSETTEYQKYFLLKDLRITQEIVAQHEVETPKQSSQQTSQPSQSQQTSTPAGNSPISVAW